MRYPIRLFTSVVCLSLFITSLRADEPLTPEQALKKMEEKAAARKRAAATQPQASPATKPTSGKPDAAKGPADDSAPVVEQVPLFGGSFQFPGPPSDKWSRAKQPTDRIAVYATKNHDTVLAIQVLPKDMAVDDTVGDAIVARLKKTRQTAKIKMVLEPTIEKDDRFALRIHERYEVAAKPGEPATGKIADQLHLYRSVSGSILMGTLDTVADDADTVKAMQAQIEAMLTGATKVASK